MTNMVHGKLLAKTISEKLLTARKQFEFTPTLAVVYFGGDFLNLKYLNSIKKEAKKLLIDVKEVKLDDDIQTDGVIEKIKILNEDKTVDSIIVLSPLKEHINKNEVFRTIDLKKDVSVLSPDAIAKFAHEEFFVLPPIVAAVQYIFEAHNISLLGKNVLVLGHDIQAGSPLAQFGRQCGAKVTVAPNNVSNLDDFTKDVEIIICSMGISELLKPNNINEGTIVIDAGLSIVDGKIKGDAHPDVAVHTSLFTPTPGGLYPVVVSSLMKNVLILARNNRNI